MRTVVIIAAGGSGTRMGGQTPKQFAELAGRPVLVRTLERIREALPDAEIVVSLPEGQTDRWVGICSEYGVDVRHIVAPGGKDRFDSVKKALDYCGDCDIIAVHDGVRPLVSAEMVRRVVECAAAHGSAVPVVAPNDSFRIVDGGGSKIIDRSLLRAVQTPQAFDAALLRRAYGSVDGAGFTDDASVVEAAGGKIILCEGEYSNIKITRAMDMSLAQTILNNEQTV